MLWNEPRPVDTVAGGIPGHWNRHAIADWRVGDENYVGTIIGMKRAVEHFGGYLDGLAGRRMFAVGAQGDPIGGGTHQ